MSGGPAAAAAATQQNEQQQLKVDDHYRAYLGARINVMLWWMLLLSGGMVAVMTGSLNPVDASEWKWCSRLEGYKKGLLMNSII